LAADAFVVIDPDPIGFQSAGGGFFVEKIDAVLDRTMQLAQRRAGASVRFSLPAVDAPSGARALTTC